MSEITKLQALFPALAKEELTALRGIVHRLSICPPQVLLFDGGTEEERRAMARYWAACTLCVERTADGPCLDCSTCQRIAHDEHFDIMAYDGYIAQKDDEASPGFFRAFTAENARGVKARLLDSPKGRYRVVFFTGIAASRPEAPNALLKILEEPSPTSLFVLLVPQREQILPTLVSRALCLTLPWPDPMAVEDTEILALTDKFAAFFANEGNFLGTITAKAFLTQNMAQRFLTACQRTVIRVLSGKRQTKLDVVFAQLTPESLMTCMDWLKEAGSLVYSAHTPVTPSRVLEALAMNLYGRVAEDRGARS